MTPNELAELLRRGEDSMIEFKRDDVQNYDWAKELAAFLNLAGGTEPELIAEEHRFIVRLLKAPIERSN